MKKRLALYDRIVLTTDLTGTMFKKDDVGTIVEIYNDGEAFEVEFFAVDGSTIAVETVPASLLMPVSGKLMLHVRQIA